MVEPSELLEDFGVVGIVLENAFVGVLGGVVLRRVSIRNLRKR
jgi:hypothetical protein